MDGLSHAKISNLESLADGKQFLLLCAQFLFFLFLLFQQKSLCPHVDLSLRSREISTTKM